MIPDSDLRPCNRVAFRIDDPNLYVLASRQREVHSHDSGCPGGDHPLAGRQTPSPDGFGLLKSASGPARVSLQGDGDDRPDVLRAQSLGLATGAGLGGSLPAHSGKRGGGEFADRIGRASPFRTTAKRGNGGRGGSERLPGVLKRSQIVGNRRIVDGPLRQPSKRRKVDSYA